MPVQWPRTVDDSLRLDDAQVPSIERNRTVLEISRPEWLQDAHLHHRFVDLCDHVYFVLDQGLDNVKTSFRMIPKA